MNEQSKSIFYFCEMNHQATLRSILKAIAPLRGEGQVATYIPELARVDPDKFGICLRFLEGNQFGVGDFREKFSIQSISKVFALTLAISKIGKEVWTRVGVEPSGSRFNSLVQLEYEQGIPRNPFINAGAIVVCDILLSNFSSPKNEVMSLVRDLAETEEIDFNAQVAESERRHGYRNFALAFFLKSFGNLHNEAEDVLDLYFHLCSIEMTCEELARSFSFFANHGSAPRRENFLTASQTKRLNALMQTCGFYDEAGEFSFKVGLPGKSGVGGGIAAIHPQRYSVAVWGPRLNQKGNSVMGLKALELLTSELVPSIF